MLIKDFIYRKLPVSLQNHACTLYGYLENKKRFNDNFYKQFDFLKVSQWWPLQAIDGYKKELLINLLFSLRKNDYFHKELDCFTDNEILDDPFQVVSNFPIMTKEDVFNYGSKIKCKNISSYLVKTRGTTGTALSIFKSNNDMSSQVAAWFRHRDRFNVSDRDLSVNFTGKAVVPIEQISPPFWRYNKAWNQYLINMQHINQDNIAVIVQFLNSIQPVFYSGYPSIISEVSRLALSNNLHLNVKSRPSVIFCGAENTLDYQYDAMKTWTGAVISALYGLTEGNCNLSQCQYGYYHEDFELCHTELEDEETLPDGKTRGLLIGTGFKLSAFPLVKYRTGDVATKMPDNFKCPCGRQSKVYHSIEGRVDDYVLTPDGKRIMRFDYLFKDTSDIYEAQIVQKVLNCIIIRLKCRNTANLDSLEKVLRYRVGEWISRDINVIFEYPDEIERSSTGKFKAVVNEL